MLILFLGGVYCPSFEGKSPCLVTHKLRIKIRLSPSDVNGFSQGHWTPVRTEAIGPSQWKRQQCRKGPLGFMRKCRKIWTPNRKESGKLFESALVSYRWVLSCTRLVVYHKWREHSSLHFPVPSKFFFFCAEHCYLLSRLAPSCSSWQLCFPANLRIEIYHNIS